MYVCILLSSNALWLLTSSLALTILLKWLLSLDFPERRYPHPKSFISVLPLH